MWHTQNFPFRTVTLIRFTYLLDLLEDGVLLCLGSELTKDACEAGVSPASE